jgi:hypothetical protein
MNLSALSVISEAAASDSPAVPASLSRSESSESRGESRSSLATDSESDPVDFQILRLGCRGRPAGDPAQGPLGLRVTRVRDALESGISGFRRTRL